jgi:WD40 repeat protein
MKRQLYFTLLAIPVLCLLLSLNNVKAQPVSPPDILSMEFSPDGGQLAVMSSDGVRIYNSVFNIISAFLNQGETRFRLIQWHPDRSKIVLLQSSPTQILVQIYNSQNSQLISNITSPHGFSGWNSDGTLAWGRRIDGNGIVVFNPVSGDIVQTIDTGNIMIETSYWSADDTRFFTPLGSRVIVMGVSEGRVIGNYSIDGSATVGIWSPDSQLIALPVTKIVPAGTPGSHPAAGEHIVYSIQIMNPNNGQLVQEFDRLEEGVSELFWDVYTNQLTAVLFTNGIVVWDLDTNRRVDSYLFSGGIRDVAQSPFGGRLLVTPSPSTPATITSQIMTPISNSVPIAEYLDGLIKLIVPAPSLERLKVIQSACVGTTLSTEIGQPTTITDLPAYISEIESLTPASISPGCASDLLAVAQAVLQTEASER